MIKITVDLAELLPLIDDLEGDIEDIVKTVLAKEAENILRKSIMQNIYGGGRGGGSEWYSSTGSIKEAFTVNQVENGFVIFMDEGKLNAYSGIPRKKLGAYVGVRGQDFRQGILNSFEFAPGAPGTVYNKYKGIPATQYFSKAFEEMDITLPQLLRDGLIARGWRVS